MLDEENIDLNVSSDAGKTEEIFTSEVKVIKVTHFICSIIDDHKYNYLQEKTQSTWCKPKALFHGVKCQVCTKLFVHEKGDSDKTFKPSVKKPLYAYCPNEKHKCTYAICADCRNSSEIAKQEINKDKEINNDEEIAIKE